MLSIFYDLETTHLTPMGQILNCCFIAVNESWKQVGRYSQEIQISPLQLPEPEAVLANRTPVLSHQRTALKTEREALKEIHTFIGDMIKRSNQGVELIGYNSGRFDLNFLRTSFIRNGLNPYFYGKVIPKDLLHTVRYLSATDPAFPRSPRPGVEGERAAKLSLGLETISHQLGLLSGKQSHHSVADVELTIRLAQTLQQTFGVDGRLYSGYPTNHLHQLGREHPVVVAVFPQTDLSSTEIATRVPYALLNHDQKSGLWIDLDKYREGKRREAIRWMGANSGALYAQVDGVVEQAYGADAKRAREEFRDITISNFFARSTCDIEADIFRLGFSEIDNLASAIWSGNAQAISAGASPDARELYIRHRLAELDWSAATETQEKRLAIYAKYRYGGACNIHKSHLEPLDPLVSNPSSHPTLSESLARIDTLRASSSNPEDHQILDELTRIFHEQR